jgi:quercetin dioxygenase-like cupin family protein
MPQGFIYLTDLASQIKDIPPDTIVSKTLENNDSFKAVLFGFAAGQELSEHTASMPAILEFISGEAELTLGGKTMTAQPCTWVHMEANLSHSIKANVPTIMLLILLKTGKEG